MEGYSYLSLFTSLTWDYFLNNAIRHLSTQYRNSYLLAKGEQNANLKQLILNLEIQSKSNFLIYLQFAHPQKKY